MSTGDETAGDKSTSDYGTDSEGGALVTVTSSRQQAGQQANGAGKSSLSHIIAASQYDVGNGTGFDSLADSNSSYARSRHSRSGSGGKGKRRSKSRRSGSSSGSGKAADPATAIALLTTFLTFAVPVAAVLLLLSGLLLAFPAHASAYVHVRWHEALSMHAASSVTASSSALSVLAPAASALVPAAAPAGLGPTAAAATAAVALSAGGGMPRFGVPPSLRRSHRFVTLALTVTSTVTLLSALLIGLAAVLAVKLLLPVALPPVPAFATATPIAGVAASVLTVAGAVLDIANADCAYTAAVATALARANAARPAAAAAAAVTAAAAAAGAATAASAASPTGGASASTGLDALSFFWGSSERVCLHGPVLKLTPALLMLGGVCLLLLVLLNVLTLSKAFNPGNRDGGNGNRIAEVQTVKGNGNSVRLPGIAGHSDSEHGGNGSAGGSNSSVNSNGVFMLKARTLPSVSLFLSQARRVLSVLVAIALPLMLISLLRASVGLEQHLLQSPAVAHDISIKVMGAHLLHAHAHSQRRTAVGAHSGEAGAARGGMGRGLGLDSAAWLGPDAATAMGPFESVADAINTWRKHVTATATAKLAADGALADADAVADAAVDADESPEALAARLGLTSGLATHTDGDGAGGPSHDSNVAAVAAASSAAGWSPERHNVTVKLGLARKVAHEFAKIVLVAKVHLTALIVLVAVVGAVAVGYVTLGAKAEQIIALTAGDYAAR